MEASLGRIQTDSFDVREHMREYTTSPHNILQHSAQYFLTNGH
jgi:hypothetical protein